MLVSIAFCASISMPMSIDNCFSALTLSNKSSCARIRCIIGLCIMNDLLCGVYNEWLLKVPTVYVYATVVESTVY